MALHQTGKPDQAEPLYRNILAMDAQQPDAWHLLGVLAWNRGDLVQGEEYVRKAIGLHNKTAAMFSNLGGILKQKGAKEEAAKAYRTALQRDANDAAALYGLGEVLVSQKEYAEAEPLLARALKKIPQNADLWNQYGLSLSEQGKLDEAKKAYQQALQFAPGHVVARRNLAEIIRAEGDYIGARRLYNEALVLRPDYAQARYDRGILDLTEGRFAEAWKNLEIVAPDWLPGMDGRRPLPWLSVPLWNGSSLRGRRILIWGDQGIGDELLFASMIPDLLAQGAEVVLECTDRLVPLFQRSFPQASVIARTPIADARMAGGISCQSPGMYLGCWLRRSSSAFPQKSFLTPDPERKSLLQARYRQFGRKRFIGISWLSRGKTLGAYRSMALRDLVAAIPHKDAVLIDLQYGDTAAEWAEIRSEFPDLLVHRDDDIDQLHDFDAFTAQVAACDAVVTIGNTTAHVAGALGMPGCVLLPRGIGLTWYWQASGAETPWYPSLQLLRPSADGSRAAALTAIWNFVERL